MIYWGDEDYSIGYDTLYESSFPYSDIVSSVASATSVFRSFGRYLKVDRPFPMALYAHDESKCPHKTPHTHVKFDNQDVPFDFEGTCLLPAGSPFKSKVTKSIKQLISDNLALAVAEWNKENPTVLVDPLTGKSVK
jgi:hypothetical protein